MIEITLITSDTGVLTKRISLGSDGTLHSDGSACVMARGRAKRVRLDSVDACANLIGRLKSSQAIALGALRSDLPEEVQVTTHGDLTGMNGSAPPNLIARTAGHIAYRATHPALALIDIDTKAMPPAVAKRIKEIGGFWAALLSVAPELAGVARVVRKSTSSGISRSDTGTAMRGSNGVHVFLLVQDGGDVERFLRTLHDRCWLGGLGWMMVGAGGQLLERSLIDRTVYAGERLVFEAPPILQEPLTQNPGPRVPTVISGEAADTRSLCRDLNLVEKARVNDLKASERHRLAGPAGEARAKFIAGQAARIAGRTGCTPAGAERTAMRQCNGILRPDVELQFDAAEFAGSTVGDVLADPDRFVGATMADPLEGIAYGACKAKVMRRADDGTLWIHSFAHGRTTYELKHDAASIEAAIGKADTAEVADLFARMLLVADLDAVEEQKLREIAGAAAGVKPRALGAKIKAARTEQARLRAKTERDDRAAARTDKRLQIIAPRPDDERLPVLLTLDEVLGASEQVEPPMRNLDGHPVEVRTRPPIWLHELTSEGANQTEPAKTRLPPPELALLTKHDRFSFAQEIERHVEFTAETESERGLRPVALHPSFVDHFIAYRDSMLPRVGAIVTAPLVLPDGELLATQGLDRARKLVFRMEPRLLEMMPSREKCTKRAAAEALDFLVDQWLCDVATDFAGKCVLIALALTILERVLLPERPAFFVTAGKRGGGKTTAIMMVILAVTGRKPPAAAWSSSEEERRKAILAYLAEGLPALVWDNIPLGTTISCPTLEKVLTTESYSDRVLGETANLTVPAFTVMAFTGNNIGPKGDMASRTLVTRLEVDRPDPENRQFTHADPVEYTLANRGKILASLYTTLLANPQLHPDQAKPRKTRFKVWWHLVGSAVENAAATLVGEQIPLDETERNARVIDFTAMFAEVEGDDEETNGVGEVLEILDNHWPGQSFSASDVVRMVNDPGPGKEDHANRLRGFFEPNGGKSATTITSKSAGRRLGAIAGNPVCVGEKTMKLIKHVPKNQSKHRHTASFSVVVAS